VDEVRRAGRERSRSDHDFAVRISDESIAPRVTDADRQSAMARSAGGAREEGIRCGRQSVLQPARSAYRRVAGNSRRDSASGAVPLRARGSRMGCFIEIDRSRGRKSGYPECGDSANEATNWTIIQENEKKRPTAYFHFVCLRKRRPQSLGGSTCEASRTKWIRGDSGSMAPRLGGSNRAVHRGSDSKLRLCPPDLY